MPLAFNCGVLEWFIRTYTEQVKACRSKADLVLRTLVKLPCMNMKQDAGVWRFDRSWVRSR